eukprot:gene5457-9270_t
MHKFLLVLVVFSFLFFTINAVPVRCGEVTVDALEYEEELDIADDLDEDLDMFQLANPCKTGKVCVHYCKRPNGSISLKHKIYLADFVQHSIGNEVDKTKAFDEACIKRTMTKSFRNLLLKKALIFVINKIKRNPKAHSRVTKSFRLAKRKWRTLLRYLEAEGTPLEQYFGQMAQMFNTFGKICVKEKHWRRTVGQKLKDFLNSGYDRSVQKEKNKSLKKYLKNKFKKLKSSESKAKDLNLSRTMKVLTKMYIRRFKRIILALDADKRYCVCDHYTSQPGISVPPQVTEKINTRCSEKMKGN